MARTPTVKTRFKKTFRRTYIKAWRLKANLSQQRLAEIVAETTGKADFSHASVGRIENGKQQYSQVILEAMAEALGTDVVSLLIRDPNDPRKIWSIWDQAMKVEKLAENYSEDQEKTGT